MAEKVCKQCRRFYEEDKCPGCKNASVATSFQGKIVVLSEESEIAKILGFNTGTFALKVRN